MDGLDDQLKRMKVQVEELTRQRDELTQLRNKLTQENSELQHRIHDLEVNLDSFSKNKSQAQQKLESTQAKLEEEIRVRHSSKKDKRVKSDNLLLSFFHEETQVQQCFSVSLFINMCWGKYLENGWR